MPHSPDLYETAALDEVTGCEGSMAHIVTLSGREQFGRIYSRVLTAERGLDAVVIDTDYGHVTVRWAAIESLRTVPEAEEA